jgi:hypothetical protein
MAEEKDKPIWFLWILLFIIVGAMFYVHFLRFVRLDTEYNSALDDLETKEIMFEDFVDYDAYSHIIQEGYNDLSSYQDKGMIIGWIDVKDWREIERVNLELCDENNCHTLKGIDNHLELEREENTIFGNEDFEDYAFNCPNQKNKMWRDFMIANGENLVFWEYNKSLPIDMSDVKLKTSYPSYDLVIMKGFCKDVNPTNSEWISPHGLIQYGFHHAENGTAYLKNVRQTQMVTNGDHTRILSKEPTPKDFILRMKFTTRDIPKKDFYIGDWMPQLKAWIEPPVNKRLNNYIRVGWDFEDSWDAGHDQTSLYCSLQYNYFGMQRVYPIVRQTKQGYEEADNKDQLKLKNNKDYEINIITQGQHARAIIYELNPLYYKKVAVVDYTFKRPRPETEYPISIEATGDVNIEVDYIEMREII